MPELPEIETIKRSLFKEVVGKVIDKVEIFLPKLIKEPKVERFQEEICNLEVLDLKRRGKYLVFVLSNRYFLVFHLGMSGQLIFKPAGDLYLLHNHLRINFQNDGTLFYNDIRQFGKIYLLKDKNIENLFNLGVEPLEESFTPFLLRELIGSRKISIKSFLLNQEYIAGIGNIYACEILFKAGIYPFRKCNTLNLREIERIANAIKEILEEAISLKGTSIQDYVNGKGEKGLFQEFLKVYQKEKCSYCQATISRIKSNGRTTYFCRECQRATPP